MSSLFDTTGFMPHGHCYLWRPEIIWLHVISDAIIVLAYYSIPIFLIYIVHKSKRAFPFHWIFVLFALFILACGTTHLMEIINIWQADYVLSGVVKALTALFSILTAITLLPLLPKIAQVLRDAMDHREK